VRSCLAAFLAREADGSGRGVDDVFGRVWKRHGWWLLRHLQDRVCLRRLLHQLQFDLQGGFGVRLQWRTSGGLPMSHCVHCGVDGAGQFCAACGRSQADGTAPAPAAVSAPAGAVSGKRKGIGCLPALGIGALGLLGLVVLLAILGGSQRGSKPSSLSIGDPPPVGQPKSAQDATVSDTESSWRYAVRQDEMGSGTIRSASVESTGTIDFGFPYQGTQHARLTLRAHPRFGKGVVLSVERGQFDCAGSEQCKVMARFDQGKAQPFRAVPPADHSTTSLFLDPFGRFLDEVVKSKTVRIEARFYEQGAPVIEFNIAAFVPGKVVGEDKPARRRNVASDDDEAQN
jgi:hypothetical protein